MDGIHRVSVKRVSSIKDFKSSLAQDVIEGISSSMTRLVLPPKYRYDGEGSRIFDEITLTPEYYLFREETAILKTYAEEIMQLAKPTEVLELGSGSSIKSKILIEAMRGVGCQRYLPLDISESALRGAATKLVQEYDWLKVCGLIGDYESELDVPKSSSGNRMIVILGSTIGNYRKGGRMNLLKSLTKVMSIGDSILVGFDSLSADINDHLKTYMDSNHLNDQFNRRQFAVIDQNLDANFSEGDFSCTYVWDEQDKAVLNVMVAKSNVSVDIRGISKRLEFSIGEKIQTGISCKFTKEQIIEDIRSVGLTVNGCYTNSSRKFSVMLASMNTL